MDTLTTPEKTPTPETPEAPSPPPKKKKVKKPMSRRKKKIIARLIWLGVFLIFCAGLAFAIWYFFFKPKPVFYETAEIYRGSLVSTAMGYGYVKPAETADIALIQSGVVLETYFVEGDRVNEGDLLYVLDSAAIDKTIADLNAEITELENENAAIAEGHQADIAASSVTAPFSGKLAGAADSGVKVGDTLMQNQIIGTMFDDSTMLLTLYYSYAYENDIKPGMKAQISIPVSMSLVDGQVSRVEKVRRITPEGNVLFEVEFSVKNPGALAKDMMATALMTSASGEEIIPADAGMLRNSREQSISADISGKISFLDTHDYYTYNAGALLCKLDYTPDTSRIELNNELIAQKREAIAAEELKYADLRKTAPISGTVMYNRLIVGEKVDPGQAVISIAQLDKMVIEAQIDERNIGGVNVGDIVNMEQWTYDGQQFFTGVIESISFEAKMDYNYVYFPAIISADNFSGTLQTNMSVQYTLPLEERYDILIAPVNAVKNTPVGVVVFVQTEERPANAIEMPPEIVVPNGFFAVPIETGMATAYGVEIVSGVDEFAKVYTQDLDYDPNAGMMEGGKTSGMAIRVG